MEQCHHVLGPRVFLCELQYIITVLFRLDVGSIVCSMNEQTNVLYMSMVHESILYGPAPIPPSNSSFWVIYHNNG